MGRSMFNSMPSDVGFPHNRVQSVSSFRIWRLESDGTFYVVCNVQVTLHWHCAQRLCGFCTFRASEHWDIHV